MFAVGSETVWLDPIAVRAVYATSATECVVNGTKISWPLTAVPAAVVSLIRPEEVNEVNGAITDVAVAEDGIDGVVLNVSRLLNATGSKPDPVIVIAVPAVAIAGLKPEIEGAPGPDITVKLVELVAEPRGAVTLMAPVVAPDGTVTIS